MAETAATPAPSPIFPSVDDLPPDEEGGPTARIGFEYQDEVAVQFVLLMLSEPTLRKVHCETHDDLVLVWEPADGPPLAEYVQVKGGWVGHQWSVARLCQKSGAASIYEKSLLKDRCKEESRFRLVTLRQVDNGLQVLTHPRGAPTRDPAHPQSTTLCAAIEEKVPELVSDKGATCREWVFHCLWQDGVTLEMLTSRNQMALMQLAMRSEQLLIQEQIDSLLANLRDLVWDAGTAKWADDKNKKIFTSHQIRNWWREKLTEIAERAAAPSGRNLRRKMSGLPEPVIKTAIEQRRRYSAAVRTPRYMDAGRGEQLGDLLRAELTTLQSEYVAGRVAANSVDFHAACLDQAKRASASRLSDGGDATFLQGLLYDIADRCLLDFNRPTR